MMEIGRNQMSMGGFCRFVGAINQISRRNMKNKLFTAKATSVFVSSKEANMARL